MTPALFHLPSAVYRLPSADYHSVMTPVWCIRNIRHLMPIQIAIPGCPLGRHGDMTTKMGDPTSQDMAGGLSKLRRTVFALALFRPIERFKSCMPYHAPRFGE